MRPKVAVSAAGISRMNSTSMKFASCVGFSNGIAELMLKNPPPFVPSCLIAICEAAGPSASVWSPPIAVVKDRAAQRLHDALGDEHAARRRTTAAAGCRAASA